MSRLATNYYDNQEFFNQYNEKYNSESYWDPAYKFFNAMVPANIKGWNILDLACGNGKFGRYMLDQGAGSVVGYDLSQKMIAEAIKVSKNDSRLQFFVADLETLELPKERYNLVHCSFGLHYISDLNRIMAEISNTLTPDGILMFIVPHPVKSCICDDYDSIIKSGKKISELNGQAIYPVSKYLAEGPSSYTCTGFQVTIHHSTISTYVNSCIKNKLDILELVECGLDNSKLRFFPNSLLIKAKKRANK